MFKVQCKCGQAVNVPETQRGRPAKCPACGEEVLCVSGETLDADAATADFDAALLVAAGPTRVGQLIRLGGCAPISIGKQPGNLLTFPGNLVSRAHCQLVRLDFGPSRWKLDDLKSTNGLFVNAERITNQGLQHGDIINVGEYELHYLTTPQAQSGSVEPAHESLELSSPVRVHTSAVAARAAFAGPATHSTGPACPSCEKLLGPSAKVCIECGIRVPSGRPLLVANHLDENAVHINTETILKFVSWLLWVTPLPMPLASEAYGKHKPYAIWAIAALTLLASLSFLVATMTDKDGAAQSAMLWPNHVDFPKAAEKVIQGSDKLRSLIRPTLHDPTGHKVHDAMRQAIEAKLREMTRPFHWWQLISSAFLHDSNSILGFVFHLGGNMVFFIVFGSRVNAIIGDTATAIVYPLLAIASGYIFLLTLPPTSVTPLLGASGAINGMAGMYLVLFPAHRVYCAMWLRLRFHLMFKIFVLRGFWVLLIYFAFDVFMVAIGKQGTTAHWAHIGGFLTGVVFGVVLLASRQFECRNGDLLSLLLGKHAWPLIGKPTRIARAK